MAGSSRWYFDKKTLADSPSKKCGIEADDELSYRQQAANLIQDMGQRLRVYVVDPFFLLLLHLFSTFVHYLPYSIIINVPFYTFFHAELNYV